MLRSLVCVPLAVFLATSLFAAGPAADLESRRKTLNDLLNERWEYVMVHDPIYASILGDKRYNDQIHDLSQKAFDDDLEQERRFLVRFEAIEPPALDSLKKLPKSSSRSSAEFV